MLDNLTARIRHILLMLFGAVLSAALVWAGQNTDTILHTLNIPDAVYPLAVTVLGALILQLTNLTKQYGLFSASTGAHEAAPLPPGPPIDPGLLGTP